MVLLKTIYESFGQAFNQLRTNKLRSFLSLLGITIGIFCIISVKSAVDSLENNIRGSFEKLGNDVIYVQKFSWGQDPGDNWWKIMRRPSPDFDDFKAITQKVRSYSLADYHVYAGSKTVKYRSSNVENVDIMAVTYDCAELFSLEFEKGRWYSPNEFYYGSPAIIIGNSVAEELFGNIEPLGKKVKLMGNKVQIIGVLQKSGDDLISVADFDETIIISYELAKKMTNIKSNHPFGTSINIKAKDGIEVEQLKADVEGTLRAHRRLKPKEENNFSLNELTLLSKILDDFFSALNLAGWIIGIFAIFVGMFSVANIMFVSVKERTNIIGIKKALGAKKFFILFEFLIESIVLCILGGLVGLLLVYGVMHIISNNIGFDIFLSLNNIVWGIGMSILIGVISGFIPALQAAKMDPVEAMRSK